MKRLFLSLLLSFSFINTAHAQVLDYMGFDATTDSTWQSLKAANNAHWVYLNDYAYSDSAYFKNNGLNMAWAYRISGDNTRAEKAFNQAISWCGLNWDAPDYQGCNSMSDDSLRADWWRVALVYHYLNDYMTQPQKDQLVDILMTAFKRQTGGERIGGASPHYSRIGDVDQSSHDYISAVITYLAIKNDFPASADTILNNTYFGGISQDSVRLPLPATCGTWTSSCRNLREAFYAYAQESGGSWLSGGDYSGSEIGVLSMTTKMIKDYLGEDPYPEFSDLYDDFISYQKGKMIPCLQSGSCTTANLDEFNYSDVQSPHAITAADVRVLWTLGVDKNDAEAKWLADSLWSSTSYGNMKVNPTLYVDPLGTLTAPSDELAYNDTGNGIVVYKSGWATEDTAIWNHVPSLPKYDHGVFYMNNFQVWRNGEWVLDYPKMYESTQNITNVSGFSPYGGLGQSTEAYGQTAYDFTTSGDIVTILHSGSTGGNLHAQWSKPARESVHEWSNSKLFWFDKLSNELVIVDHTRLDSTDPRTLSGFDSQAYFRGQSTKINRANGRHVWRINSNTKPTVINNDSFYWIAENGEPVYVDNLWDQDFDQYYYEVARFACDSNPNRDSRMQAIVSANGGVCPSTNYVEGQPRIIGDGTSDFGQYGYANASTPLYNKWQTHLYTTGDTSGFQNFWNVISLKNRPTTTKIVGDNSGEKAEGVLVNSTNYDWAYIGNANEGPFICDTLDYGLPGCEEYTPEAGPYKKFDSNKFEKISKLHYFRTGFGIGIGTTAAIDYVYIADLDPSREWQYSINSTDSVSLNVDDQGFVILQLDANPDEHFISINSTSLCNATDWRGCNDYDTCVAYNHYWYNNECNEEPDPSTTCSNANWTACTSQSTCEAVSRYWYNSVCNQFAEAATCDDVCDICSNESTCLTSNQTCYWYDAGTCNSTPEGGAGEATVVVLNPTQDTYGQGNSGNVNTNYNTQGLALTSYISDPTYSRATFLKFDLSSIPTGSTIVSATLNFQIQNYNYSGNQFYVHELLVDFEESEATWNNRKTGVPWTVAGARGNGTDMRGDYKGDTTNNLAYFSSPGVQVGTRFDYESTSRFKTLVQDKIGENLLLVINQEYLDNNYTRYYDRESGNGPRLTITYIPPTAPEGSIGGGVQRRRLRQFNLFSGSF